MIQAPDPIAALQPANLMEFKSGPVMDGQAPVDGRKTCFRDRKGWYWAHQAGDDGGMTNYVFEFSYPSQPTFDYPEGRTKPADGDAVKWLQWYVQRDDGYLGAPSSYPQIGRAHV